MYKDKIAQTRKIVMSNQEVIELLKDAFELKRQAEYKRAMELLYKALTICPDNAEILSQVAELHILLDNPDSAGAIYNKLFEQQPDNVDVFESLVKYYLLLHNFEKAERILEKFTLSYPSDKACSIYLEALSEMKKFDKLIAVYEEKSLAARQLPDLDKYYAIALLGQKKYHEARNIFEKIVQNGKHDEKLQLGYAQTLYFLEEYELAKMAILPFVNVSNDAVLYNLCGELEVKNEDFETAIDFFSKAVKLKYNGLYFYNLATAYFLNGQFKEAENFYLKAISASPDVEEYRYALAYVFYKLKEYKKAERILDELLKRTPDFNEAVLLRANVAFEQNEFFLAEKQLQAGEFSAEDAEFLKISAKIAHALYKYETAQSYLQAFINLYPTAVDERYELASVYFDMAKFDDALNLLLEIIEKNPKYVDAYALAAQIYVKRFDFEKALAYADSALSLDLNCMEALFTKAFCYFELKQFDAAIENAKKLLSYNPAMSEAYALLGNAYSEKNAYSDALEYYEEAMSLDAKNADYLLKLGNLNALRGNTKDAIRYFNLAHAINPDNKEITNKLIDVYVKTSKYKHALDLLYKLYFVAKDDTSKSEIQSQIKEIDGMFKTSSTVVNYWWWKIFKI